MIKITYDLFQELGIPMRMYGAVYLMDVVRYCIKDPSLMDAVYGRLYPKVAELYPVQPRAIEKAIRIAIEAAFAKGDAEVLYRLCGDSVNPEKAKLTNKHFIKVLVEEVQRRMKQEELEGGKPPLENI